MSVPAMGGGLGFAPEATKVGGGAFTPGSYTWRRLRAPTVDLGGIDMSSNFPMEISGFLTPTGPYKAGAFFGGTMDMLPRTGNVMGLLWYALMGDLSSVTGKDMDNNSVVGVNTHYFRHNALNTVPWLAMRSIIPGSVAADTLAQYGIDCKINAAQIRMTATGKMTAKIGVVGRIPKWEKNPTLVWNNTFEDETTVPQACDTRLTIGADGPTVTSCQIDIINTLSSPTQEMIFGSRHPDDFVPLGRVVNIRVMTKWNNADFFLKNKTGSSSGSTWDPNPFITSGLALPNPAFNFEADAPAIIAGSTPFSFAIRGSRSVWMPDGNPVMAAGGLVKQAYSAQLTTSLTGEDYVQLILQNNAAPAAYAWT